MDSCLLCLEINTDLMNCIRADSKRWQELNISNTIEKHFWPLSTIQCNSWICSPCWRIVDDFHKFYLRIEESRMKLVIKLEKEDINEFNTQKTNFSQNSEELDADVNVKNEPVESDENSVIVCAMSLQQTADYQLDKKINATMEKCVRKRKHSKEDITEAENITEESKNKKKQVDYDDSESATDTDYDDIDLNSMSETNTSEDDGKYYDKVLLSREENDKIIADYFKQITCDVCKIPLDNFFSVLKHFFEAHQQKGYIRCCKRQFFNRTDLADHICSHPNPNYLKCAQCRKYFSDSTILEAHKLRAHKTKNIFKSDVCGKLYLSAQNLNMRKSSSHLTEEERKIGYQDCDKSSRQTFDLKIYLDEMFRAQMEKMAQQNKKIMEALAAQNALTKMLIKQDEAANNLSKLFPINSEESLIELEKQIQENSKHVYLAAIKDIVKKNICKNIGLVISEDLLYTFNTDGTHGKKRLKDFANFYDVLKEAVKADADIDDVEGAIRKAISLIKKRHLKKILKERSIQTHTDHV